jgi:hypothetical protein
MVVHFFLNEKLVFIRPKPFGTCHLGRDWGSVIVFGHSGIHDYPY